MRVASFNLEKNGESSPLDKKAQVETFIHQCCSNDSWDVDVVFLCEVHSARLDDYYDYLRGVYQNYDVHAFAGGHSNGYIVITRKGPHLEVVSQGHLKGLNRDLIAVVAQGVNGYTGLLFLAHFKSGQGGLTKSQLRDCTSLDGHWVATGDLNLDYTRVEELDTPGVAYECWQGQATHAKGGILDWVLASVDVKVAPFDISGWADAFDMSGPDHRPIVFDVLS
ncbi:MULTISPECIES: endonuclease/exonuclease/phosphatase family protein [unclassified Chromobacterium]|uniref:endonuclease/exonuclease/phosphatase family protein n=1 Tax=unclassified Chromobacterium TaxID=2641838 RepID=UPI001F298AE6|nr:MULTISPECIES: endonuclease/exonuclease/phosphatase family protein [unclassified Chromobacterium]MCP1290755.1 endonuclease/exonuclease/phosphatase family protein [Chromobacterium sp. S0633]UJB29986.1 endonuclease/exonuclease/phosphatase family protein [Chromobacterium sp. Beijing]